MDPKEKYREYLSLEADIIEILDVLKLPHRTAGETGRSLRKVNMQIDKIVLENEKLKNQLKSLS